MKTYEGNTIKIGYMPCAVPCINKLVEGNAIYIANDEGKYTIDNGNFIFVQDLAETQNVERFVKGIEYIDKYASNGLRDKCWKLLIWMEQEAQKGGVKYSQMIAFFCDLGCWKEKHLCQKHLWNKEFKQYLYNNMWNYYLVN